MRRAWGFTATVAAALMLTSGAVLANDAPVVHVKAVVKDGAVSLEAQSTGAFDYTTYRPSESLYVLDLSGVSAGDSAGAKVVPSEFVKSYRVTSYSAGQKPVVRVEILLRPGVEPRLQRTDNHELMLLVSANGNADASAKPVAITTAPAPQGVAPQAHTAAPAAVKTASTRTAPAASATTGYEAIKQVSLAQNGDKTEVNITGSAKLDYKVTRLSNPDRIVLDFTGAHLKTSEKNIASNLDPVREIRLAQFTPEVSRVVIDLRAPAHYNVNASGNAVTVTFAAATSTGATKSAPETQPTEVTTTKTDIPAPAPVAISAPAQPATKEIAAVAAPAPAVVVPAPVASLPSTLTGSSSALASPAIATPAPKSETKSESSPAPNVVIAVTTPGPATEQQAATPPPAGRYSGEPISVNLKDVDLRDFFRLIHEISGLNVVVDPAVKGSLTIVLDDVPWDQALDIVLKNNDLDKQLDGNVLRIATKDTLKKEADQNRELARAQAEAADVVTTTRVLSYAKAEDLVPTMKKFLSSRGDILADSRSNTLIIRDVPNVLPVLDNLLRQLDRKSQQVEIEARVVAANRSFSREIGTQLALALASGHSIVGGASAVGTSPITHSPAPPLYVGAPSNGLPPSSAPMPLLTNLGATTPTSAHRRPQTASIPRSVAPRTPQARRARQ
jgi:type IV pilus assembly protein PilQ